LLATGSITATARLLALEAGVGPGSRRVRHRAEVWAGILSFEGLGGILPRSEKIPAQTVKWRYGAAVEALASDFFDFDSVDDVESDDVPDVDPESPFFDSVVVEVDDVVDVDDDLPRLSVL
jgi:hypothetical protein